MKRITILATVIGLAAMFTAGSGGSSKKAEEPYAPVIDPANFIR